MANKHSSINWNLLEKILRSMCAPTVIAARLGVSPGTLEQACKLEKKQGFSEYAARFYADYQQLIHEAEQAPEQLQSPDDQHVDRLAQYCIEMNIPFKIEKIDSTMEIYYSLIDVTSQSKAQAILENLMLTAFQSHKNSYWDWICRELVFEEFTYLTNGEHKADALYELQCIGEQNEINDEILDMYNERISRFNNNPHIYR